MKLSITTKLILLTTLLVAVTALTITSYLYQNSATILVDMALEGLTEDVSREGDKIRHRLTTLKKDARFLSATPPIQGLIRANNNAGYDKLGASSAEQWKALLNDIFKAIAQGSPDIYQIRLIDKQGNEQVKIIRNADNKLVRVKQSQLQNKLHRNYVNDGLKFKQGEVNLSRINLNREFGKITQPHTLVLRATTPIYSSQQQLFGLIVINLDFSQQIRRIEDIYSDKDKTLYLTNRDGAYLSHNDPAKRYGSDLGHRYRIQEDFPELATLFAPDNTETSRTLVPDQRNGKVMVFVKIPFDIHNKSRYLAVGLTQNYKDIIAAETKALHRNIWIVLLLVLTGIMLAIGFAGLLTTPLRQIIFGLDRLLKNDTYVIPVRSDDEIGKLASTLNQMASDVRKSQRELHALNARLEDEVEERTHELHVNLQLVNTINAAQTTFISEPKPQHAFEVMLKGLLEISDSEYGLIGEVLYQEDGMPYLKTIAITNADGNKEPPHFYNVQADTDLELFNLNTLLHQLMATGKPVISNEPANDPRLNNTLPKHPQLNSFLGIPIYNQKKLIGMAGIANRLQGYDEVLLHHLGPFITTCANMIASIRTQQEARQKDLELQQARADLERTIKSSTAVFYTARAFGDFSATFISNNIVQQLGYEPDDFIHDATFWAEHIHPDDKQRVFDELAAVFEKGEHSHSYRFRDKQGNYRWMQDELRLHSDEEGNPVELAGFWTDITERKQAELKLQESEFRHRSIIDSMIDSVITIDTQGRIKSFNTAAVKMFGFQAHEVVGKNIKMLMPEPFHSGHDGYLEKYHATHKKHIIGLGREVEAKHRDGKIFPISLSVNEMQIGDEQLYTGVLRDITEEKQAEQALRESESRFRHMADAAPALIWLADENNQGTWFNKSWLDYTGRSLSQELGNGWVAGIHADDLDQSVDYCNKAFVKRESFEMEFRLRRADGSYGWIVDTGIPRFTDSGDFEGYIGYCWDISDRKIAEQALLESEEKFRSIITSSPMGVFIYELQDDDRLVFADYNPAASAILGIDCGQYIGLPLEEAFPNLATTSIPQIYRRVAREGIPWNTEDLDYNDNQDIASAFDMHAFQTTPGKLAVMFLDVTERMQAQDELMRFKTTLDMTNDCVFMFSPDKLNLFYANQGTILQTDYAYDELLRMHPYDLLPEFDADSFQKQIAPFAAQDKGSAILETTLADRQGKTTEVELHLQFIHPSGEAARFVAIMRDITERKKVDRIKNEFVSTVSHELRTPLTSIRGALGLISGGTVGKLTQKTKQMIDIASNNTERLLLLINDILDIQKIESGNLSFKFRSLPVMPLIEKAIMANTAYADQYQVNFKLTHTLDKVHILADEDRLMQVLNNLMSNAVKFSKPDDTVELAVARHENAIRISVTDYGPGIPESFQGKLFERFTQSDASDSRQKGGTGLGLSIAKAIVDKHGGLIDFITHPGVGTTMYIELPLVKKTSLPPDNLLPHHLPDHKPCLLIIEDDADVAALLQRMLAEAGYNSDIATDITTAEKLLALNHSHYKAITLDIELPDMNGIDFLNRLRTQGNTRDLPAIVVSAQADENKKRLNGGAIGVIDWLDKPIDEPRLIAAIKLACGNNKRPHVLHVEDEEDIHRIVKSLLGDEIELSWAKNLAESKQKLNDNLYDMVLLDIGLPDGSGLELLPLLDTCKSPPKLVIFSAQDISDVAIKQVSAIISKNNTGNAHLMQTISSVLHSRNC